ncbi:flagellar brake protein [Vibrio sp. YMD68]|uniref:flagellar brake protein n=1 Tax=Vibrio sp. YMD68 TaxID=3042300 RepID=UPI00249A744A|nr:flagellar brake protein [Vibrio sp. YMD68]WGV97933.1 flagellar brake protein [Vibrio sp. YMD68]
MSTQTAKASVNPNKQQDSTVSTLNSTDALAMIEHGSEMTITVTTPIGRKFRCTTQFIGTHPDNLILIEIPSVSKDELAFFFQTGFLLNVRGISPRGEGAQIHFKSQIQHVIEDPLAMIAISIPNGMQVTQLRKEARYEINLMGAVVQGDSKTQCEIRDLSKSGCRFFTPPLGRTFQVGDTIAIDLHHTIDQPKCPPLIGKICNLQRSAHYSRYGLQFDDVGQANVKVLLSRLKFNGTKLAFANKKK